MSKTLNLWFVTQMSLDIPYSLMNWWNLVQAEIITNVRVQSPSHNFWVLFTSSSAFSVSSFLWNYALFLFQPMTLTQSFHCFLKTSIHTHLFIFSLFFLFSVLDNLPETLQSTRVSTQDSSPFLVTHFSLLSSLKNKQRNKKQIETSLVVQWLGSLLPMQGMQFRSLVREQRSHV